MPSRSALAALSLVVVAAAALVACGGTTEDPPVADAPRLSPLAELGDSLFHDARLSASGTMSCASCHAAVAGHAAPNALSVQLGGPAGDRPGTRAAPSLRYLATNTPLSFDADGAPSGGFFWDGRAASLREQAAGPLLNPIEMANASRGEVIERLRRSPSADIFRRVFGADALDQVDAAFDRVTLALQQYQLEDPAFRPFDSKFDAWLRGQVLLSPAEARGLALFESPTKGNCAACHPSTRETDGRHPLFTDFSYDALGVPRNRRLAANASPTHHDLGLCARPGADPAARPDLCGAFKVPSLRNVALRQAYFHNGVFASLEEVVTFYVQRDTHPEKWYGRRADGSVDRFDDLPEAYKGNVNVDEAPYDRRPGDAPALDAAEIADVVAFLRTLSDGWRR